MATRVSAAVGGTPDENHASHHHHTLHEIVSNIDERDAEERYLEEAADNAVDVPIPNHTEHHFESPSSSEDEMIIVAWEENDPENPHNWSSLRKVFISVTAVLTLLNSTMGSSLPSNAIPEITAEWGVTSTTQQVLPMSTFMIGYILGPLVWAPLSEQIGRRNLTVVMFALFMVWTMGCALAPNWAALLVFRLLTGICASAPLAVSAGILADIYAQAQPRGRAMAFFITAIVFGPLLAPIISGFCATTIGWRWAFWIALIYAGASLVLVVLTLPETFAPVLLKQRAVQLRRADPEKHANVVAPHELERRSLAELATVVLTRPLRMIAFELIVTCACVYLALVYSIFYMSFQAFPLIFEGVYGFSAGVDGLLFLSIGAGALLALGTFFLYDGYFMRACARHAPWTRKEEYHRLPLACIGGPLFGLSLFWLGWTARSDVSFVAPMLAGVPFGMGFVLIFIALLNYLTGEYTTPAHFLAMDDADGPDAYEIFAASAHAAASCFRSIVATVLPLATTAMFSRLSIAGACSLLGGLSLLMCLIPFIFIWKGETIRAGSSFCTALQERKLEMQRKVQEQRRRLQTQEQLLVVPTPKEETSVVMAPKTNDEMV